MMISQRGHQTADQLFDVLGGTWGRATRWARRGAKCQAQPPGREPGTTAAAGHPTGKKVTTRAGWPLRRGARPRELCLNDLLVVRLAGDSVRLHPRQDILPDRHRERVWPLEHHADATPQGHELDPGGVNAGAVEEDLALVPVLADLVVHPVEGAEEGGFTGTRRTDQGRDLSLGGCRRLCLTEPSPNRNPAPAPCFHRGAEFLITDGGFIDVDGENISAGKGGGVVLMASINDYQTAVCSSHSEETLGQPVERRVNGRRQPNL